MRYIIPLLAYGVIILSLCLASKVFREMNPKYSIFDDILLFGGMPVTLGYYFYVVANPGNTLKFVSDVMGEHGIILKFLLAWTLISGMIFLWRNLVSKLPRKESL